MKRFLVLLLALSFSLLWSESPPLMTSQEPEQLIINNRILAKINDKTISVIDVMKKMDLYLQRHHPEVATSKLARYQFYSSQWKESLSQMIDQELMISDSERLELKITDAEIREEMFERFGPNMMAALDQLGMSYEEARQLILAEMIVQRMLWFRVNSKVINNINPLVIKEAYKHFCANNPSLEQWEYQVLSLRSANQALSEMLSKKAFDLLRTSADNAGDVIQQVKEGLPESDQDVTISWSSLFQVDEKSISQTHKDVVKTLPVGSFSEPIAQISRADNSVVYRIFHLKSHHKKETPSFEKMADRLKEELLQRDFSKENANYIARLHERYGYDEKLMLESLPDDFHPFSIQ